MDQPTHGQQVWLETVVFSGETEATRVVLDGRCGNKVYIRRVDPSDLYPERVAFQYGVDEVVPTLAIEVSGIHMTDRAGTLEDLLCFSRVVPVRREGSTVYGRMLQPYEPDPGTRVHLRPDDQFVVEKEDLFVDLDALD